MCNGPPPLSHHGTIANGTLGVDQCSAGGQPVDTADPDKGVYAIKRVRLIEALLIRHTFAQTGDETLLHRPADFVCERGVWQRPLDRHID